MQHYNTNTNLDFGKDLHHILKIFSFFLHILGFIIYAMKKNKNPKAAKSACEMAIAGFFFGLFLQMLSYAYTNR